MKWVSEGIYPNCWLLKLANESYGETLRWLVVLFMYNGFVTPLDFLELQLLNLSLLRNEAIPDVPKVCLYIVDYPSTPFLCCFT